MAQELHFRRAAQLANVAQPALSRSVQTLEAELGVQLLARNNRNVRLTEAGKEFLAGCIDIVETMDSTISKSVRAGQTEFGGLNIGYTYIAMCGELPKLLAEFEQKHPAIKIDAVGESSVGQLEQLHHRELDVCFLSGPVDSQEVDSTVFQNDEFVVIANHNNQFAEKSSITVHELSREKILLRPDAKAYCFNQHVYEFFNEAGLSPSFEYVDEDHVGLLGKVALNRGVCIATAGYGCVYAENLSTIKLVGTNKTMPTIMAWHKDVHSESLLAFREFIKTRIRASTLEPSPSVRKGIPELS